LIVELDVLTSETAGSDAVISPGAILFEAAAPAPVFVNGSWQYTVETGGLSLTPGVTYAVIFDSWAAHDGTYDSTFAVGDWEDGTDDYEDGGFFWHNASSGTREQHFSQDWEAWYFDDANGGVTFDMGLRLEFDSVNVIDGTPGDDTLIGTTGEDQINGYEGSDYIRGAEGNDELNGGDGDDYLSGGAGDDAINGGAGYDRAAFSVGATGGVTVDLNQ
jgi:Ca2+-binding RTX toxin-like protein